MCEHCRASIEDVLIEASRDPHLIALVLAGHSRARWFRQRLRQTILDLRSGENRAEQLLIRLGELLAERPGAGGHCGPLLRRAAAPVVKKVDHGLRAAAAASEWRFETTGGRPASGRVRTA